jgi:hypothetical protein
MVYRIPSFDALRGLLRLSIGSALQRFGHLLLEAVFALVPELKPGKFWTEWGLPDDVLKILGYAGLCPAESADRILRPGVVLRAQQHVAVAAP